MKFVYILVEGQTEEIFVRDVLPLAFDTNKISFTPVLVKTRLAHGSNPAHKGGVVSYEKVAGDVRRLLKDSSFSCVTTMLDFYGIASLGFPGWGEWNQNSTSAQKVQHLEKAFEKDINHPRFHAYFSLHEIEALLFSDISKLAKIIPNSDKALSKLEKVRNDYPTPEDINEKKPPSFHLIEHLPGYTKTDAALIAIEIGFERMRHDCLHFNEWITFLEDL